MITFSSKSKDTVVSYGITVDEVAEILIFIGIEKLIEAVKIANNRQWCTPQDKFRPMLLLVKNDEYKGVP